MSRQLVSVVGDTIDECMTIVGRLQLVETVVDPRSTPGCAVIVVAEPEIGRRLVDAATAAGKLAELHDTYVAAVQSIFRRFGDSITPGVIRRTCSPALPNDVLFEPTA